MIPEFVKTLPLLKIPGVGKVTAKKLEQMGLTTCADVQAFDHAQLIQRFGKFGHVLIERAQGVDPRALSTHRERKSVGVETTLAKRHPYVRSVQSGDAAVNSRVGRTGKP